MDAIDDLGDAIDVTRNRLTPFRKGTWLRLTIIVFFVSSLGLGGPMVPSGDVSMGTDDPTFESDQPQGFEDIPTDELPTDELIFWGLVIGAILFVVWLVYELIAAGMEFAFLESLRSSDVHVRRYFSANFGKGLWLFLFRMGLRVLFGAIIGVPALFVFFSTEVTLEGLSIGLFLLFLLYALGLGLIYAIASRFTTEFVAPVMLLEDSGVLRAWGQFWTTMKANWTEYGLYLLLVWILQFIVRIAAWLVIGFASLIVLIPFGIVAVSLVFALGPAGLVLALLFSIIGSVLVILLASLVYVPFTTYFRYYALLLLGDTNADFDLIPDRRGAVRSGGGLADRGDRTDTDEPTGFGASDDSDADRSSGWDDEPIDRDGTDDAEDGVTDDEDDGWR